MKTFYPLLTDFTFLVWYDSKSGIREYIIPMNYQDLPISLKVKAVEHWQKDEKVHPLTCGTDSSHRPLHPFFKHSTKEFYLMCLNCQYKQTWVPEEVFTKFFRDKQVVSKPQFFLFHEFKPNLANTVNGVEKFEFFDIHYLNSHFVLISGNEEPKYYHVKGKMGESLGMVFERDRIVYNEKGFAEIVGPETFNQNYQRHF